MALSPARLRMLRVVADEGSLGRAAKVLNLTQPALSRSIKELERQLGVALFERTPTGMMRTAYADILLPYARHLSDEMDRALDEIATVRDRRRATVRIGAVASVTGRVLPGLIARVMAKWPATNFLIYERREDLLRDALVAGEIDLAIGSVIPEGQDIIRIDDAGIEEECLVLAAADSPLQRCTDLRMGDLANRDWALLPSSSLIHRSWQRLLAENGVAPFPIRMESESFSVIRELVENQNFLTWGPRPLFAANEGAIRPLAVRGMRLHRHFHFYRRKSGVVQPAVTRFLAEAAASA